MEPTLYILMRNDLESMNPGKAIAQGSHATNMFESDLRMVISGQNAYDLGVADTKWRNGRAFGRCLTVSVTGEQLRDTIEYANKVSNFLTGIVHDPTYPINDGKIVHHVPLDTCGYVLYIAVMPITKSTICLFLIN